MSNFLKFIEEDIEAKKTLISTMPTNTKRDIKKFNEAIGTIMGKYNEYKVSVKKYLDTKSKSFNIKCDDRGLEELSKKVNNLERVRFVLNPTNTHFEKLGFDNLIYQISNYTDINFNTLNEIINQFLDKFELAKIKLASDDFDYTCYVNEYMTAFFGVRDKKSKDYDEVSEIFEKIYWINPEIIEHIELNFRKLIKKYEKRFIDYIEDLQKEVKLENKIIDYEDCYEKLKEAYTKLNVAEKENLSDIIELAKDGTIDVNNFFADSKVRITVYSSLMIEQLNVEDKTIMDKFYENLEKLKINVEEFSNYVKFVPLFQGFRKEYEKLVPNGDKASNKGNSDKDLKAVETQIANKETNLEKINKKISGNGIFGSKNDNALKQLKIEAVKQAKELYELYKKFDQEYFKNKVLSILNNSLTISELLHLYYSFDYFKKMAIKKVFNITTYNEMKTYSDEFDLYAMNPTNIIIDGVPVFEESNLAKVIINKYRLSNINLIEENFDPDNLKSLLDKIQLILRIREVEQSTTTVEKIWFMAQVEKINRAANKETSA